jgi:hypothetical protein
MSDVVDHVVLGARVSLPQLVHERVLPYRTEKRAKVWLDGLRVPFVIICRQRHYRLDDIKAAIDRETRSPRLQRRCGRVADAVSAGPI